MSGSVTFDSMFSTSIRRVSAVALACALSVSACGDKGAELKGAVVKDGVGCLIAQVDRRSDKPTLGATARVEKASTKDLKAAAKDACNTDTAAYLTLDMVGVKASDGSEFVNTFGTDRPFTAQLGKGELITGLENGLKGMAVGARRQITVPAADAYGADGDTLTGIGPDETLVFVVDLISVTSTAQYCNLNRQIPPAPDGTPGGETKPTTPIEMPLRPPTELKISTVTPSEGTEVAEGDKVKMNYLGISCASGAQFDTSWDRGEPFEATAGGSDTIDGFSKGLIGARVGELRRLDIPAAEAYGDDALIFLIQVVEIVPPAEETTTTTATETTEAPASTTEAAEAGSATTEAPASTEASATTEG